MIIKWPNWLIEDYKKGYGYVIKRKTDGTDRWKVFGYYPELSQAIAALFKERIRIEMVDIIIDTVNATQTRINTAKLLKKIDDKAAEIEEALDGLR